MKNRKKLTLHNRAEMIRRELIDTNEQIEEVFQKAKFEKMSDTPYAFYRGSNHLFWADFYNDWRFCLFGGREETLTWINGDAHIYNYGAYANHRGEAIYGMDDFDDSIHADYQYDLWRMAISIVLDCRANGTFDFEDQKHALVRFAQAYLKEICSYEADDIHKEVLINRHSASGILKDFLEKVEQKKSRKKMLKKCTCNVGADRKFDYNHKKLEKVTKDEYQALLNAFNNYQSTLSSDFTSKDAQHFEIKDIARRMWSGTGSLGLDRFFVLLEGDDETDDDDIILDVKELGKPPLYDHMSSKEQAEYNRAFKHEGERHAEAYRALAEHPDKYLGWLTVGDQVFSVRERSPFKADFPSDELKKPEELYFMADVWGKLLATRHERASHRLNDDPYELPKALAEVTKDRQDQFIRLVAEIAFNYADCVEHDWRSFLELTVVDESVSQ